MGAVTIGVDLGQRRDPTAIAVVDAAPRPRERGGTEQHYLARYLERLPLQTPYPRVAARVVEIAAGVAARGGGPPGSSSTRPASGSRWSTCCVTRASRRTLVPVYFTHGDRRTLERGELKLGKAWLVSHLQALPADRTTAPAANGGGRGAGGGAAHLRDPGRRGRQRQVRGVQGRDARRPRDGPRAGDASGRGPLCRAGPAGPGGVRGAVHLGRGGGAARGGTGWAGAERWR